MTEQGGLAARWEITAAVGKIRKPDGLSALSSYPLDGYGETWVTPLGAGSSRALADHTGSSLSVLRWALRAAHTTRYFQDPVPKYLDRIACQGLVLVTGDVAPTRALRQFQIAIWEPRHRHILVKR